MVHCLVKGKDDFGRHVIDEKRAKYDIIGYVKPVIGDAVIILYIDKKTYLIYRVTQPTESYEKDYPHIFTGIMEIAKFEEYFAQATVQEQNEIINFFKSNGDKGID